MTGDAAVQEMALTSRPYLAGLMGFFPCGVALLFPTRRP